MNRQALKQTLAHLFLRFYRIVAVVVVLVILGLGYVIVLQTKIGQVRSGSLDVLEQQRIQLAQRQTYLKSLRHMSERFTREVSTQDRAFVDRAVPSAPDIPELLTALQDVAEVVGGSVSQVTIASQSAAAAEASSGQVSGVESLIRGRSANAAGPGGLTRDITVRFELSGSGGYATLKTFLDALESSDRLMNVEAIQFSLSRQASEPGQQGSAATFGVTITTSYFPETT